MDLKTCLDNLQKECNELYNEYGASDEVIDLQASINALRHKFDVTDDSEKVYEDFVQ